MKKRSKRLIVKTYKVEDIAPTVLEDMWEIYRSNYDNVTRAEFDRDLNEKTHVFLGMDSGDESIQGFSACKFYFQNVKGKKVGVLFSGDTMIDKDYWGQKALHTAFMKEVFSWKLRHPFTPLYWFIITMGFKTYLIMAKNAVEYWPRHDQSTPSDKKALIDALAGSKFGADYDPETGLISPSKTGCTLGDHVAPITNKVMMIPEIKFFISKNPNYAKGVELANICRLDSRWLLRMVFKFSCKTLFKLIKTKKIVSPILEKV